MKRKRAEAVIEAVLFTMGESVEIGRLADVIEEDVKTLKDILKGMEERYAREDRGITLVRFEDSVQLCTKEDMYEYLVKIAKVPKKMSLTDTVLETLAFCCRPHFRRACLEYAARSDSAWRPAQRDGRIWLSAPLQVGRASQPPPWQPLPAAAGPPGEP